MTILEMLIGCLLRIVLPGIVVLGVAGWVTRKVCKS